MTLRPLENRKILIIVENLPVPFDRRVWQEAKTLRDAGAKVAIICPTGKGFEKKEEILEDIYIYRHTMPVEATGKLGFFIEYSVALFHEFRLAWKIFFTHGFDTIHACNPPDLIFLIALPFKMIGKKFVFDHHDINPELFEAKFGKKGFFWKLLCIFEWLTFKTADIVISTNDSYKNIALKRGNINQDNIFVVRSGPDLLRLKPVPENVSHKNGRKYLIGYVGVMGEQEGLDLLLESVKYIKDIRTDIQFVLVGGGPQLEILKQQAINMNLENYVTFLGRVPDDILLEVLSTADICVNPDRVNPMNDKSTMNKILEYMAMGKPIVQFDVTEGKKSARYSSLYAKSNDPLDFANKIIYLINNEKLRSKMGKYGHQRIQRKLSWDYEAPKLIEAYIKSVKK